MNEMTSVPPETAPVVSAIHLTKIFKDFWQRPKVRAVDDISFEIRRGEVFGLLGPNGSGKSTTIKMMLGLLTPTKGQLRILGRSTRDVKAKARVGYLPEESYLYPYLTSEETLHFFGRLFALSNRERCERINQLLDMVGLQHVRHRVIGEFSKGMARRIGLAQALVNDPDLVILDEPTSGLDPLGCRQVKNLIRTLAQRGKTVLLSSHLLADVEDVCDRIAILYSGRMHAIGAIEDLLEQKNRFQIKLPDELPPGEIEHVLSELRARIGDVMIEHPQSTLEDFFLDIISKARARSEENVSGAAPTQKVAEYLTQNDEGLTFSPNELMSKNTAPSDKAEENNSPTPKKSDVNERLRYLTDSSKNNTSTDE